MDNRPNGTIEPPSLSTIVRGMFPSILFNAVLVLLIYALVKRLTPASDVVALLLSAVPAMLFTVAGIIRQGQVDVLGAFALVSIAFSIALTFFTGDARLFLMRESFLTVVFSLVGLVSLRFPRPLWFYILRYFAAGNNPAGIAAWQYAGFRTYVRNVTIFWGLVYVLEFALRVVLVYTLPIAQVC